MRQRSSFAFGRAAPFFLLIAPFMIADANASLVVSTATTENVVCSGDVCAPTATNAVLNVNDLENLLASGSVKVTTTGSSVQAKNLLIEAALSWSTSSALTLDASHAIKIDQLVSVEGLAGLTLTAGGKNGTFSFGKLGNITFADLSSSLMINRTIYALYGDIKTLASAIAANPSGSYALANGYDASTDGTYSSPPIATVFNGKFDGLGNTISNLSINDPTKGDYVGLFSEVGQVGRVGDISMLRAKVRGSTKAYAGTLVGLSFGTVERSRVSGTVVHGADLGGLVGVASGTIDRCSSTVSLTANEYRHVAGGLVGASAATISNSTAAGAVVGETAGGLVGDNSGIINHSHASGTIAGGSAIGGLVGNNSGTISASHSTGSIISGGFVGGLVGENQGGTVTGSHATGKVAGAYAGGLVGYNVSTQSGGGVIEQSFATGSVEANIIGTGAWVGGLVGANDTWELGQPGGTISQSFATGPVSGGNGGLTGGLVGRNVNSTISNSYATGAVTAKTNAYVGGLIGENGDDASDPGYVEYSYSIGTVTAGSGSYIGGFMGFQAADSGSATDCYWDTDLSGITNLSQGAGNVPNDPGITGLSTTQFQSGLPSGFDSAVWAENSSINDGLPYLIANPPPK